MGGIRQAITQTNKHAKTNKQIDPANQTSQPKDIKPGQAIWTNFAHAQLSVWRLQLQLTRAVQTVSCAALWPAQQSQSYYANTQNTERVTTLSTLTFSNHQH